MDQSAHLLRFDQLIPPQYTNLLKDVKKFMESEIVPIIDDKYEEGEFPMHTIQSLKKLKLLEQYWNLIDKRDIFALSLIAFQMGRYDANFATFLTIVQAFTMTCIAGSGNEEQKRRFLPGMSTLDIIGAMGLTEPNAGSDSTNISTTATKVKNGWLLNGKKIWTGNGTIADIIVIWAKEKESGELHGFIVDRRETYEEQNQYNNPHKPTLIVSKIKRKIGMRMLQNAEIQFSSLFVPEKNHLEVTSHNQGPAKVLFQSRIIASWIPIGVALGAYDATFSYLKRRKQFGTSLLNMQMVQEKMIKMTSNLTSCLFMALRMTQLAADGQATSGQVSMVKAHNTKACRENVSLARELMGAYGITGDSKVGRAFADMEALYTYDGTYDINILIAGREFLGYSAFVPKVDIRKKKSGPVLKKMGDLTMYLMTQDDVPEAVEVALETFVKQQEIAIVVRCTVDDYEPLFQTVFSQSVPDECSVVVRDPKGRMIAFAVANDFAGGDPPGIVERLLENPRMRAITSLRVSVEEAYRERLPPSLKEKGKILHVFMGGTLPHEQNNRIASEMANMQCELGRKKGYIRGYGNVTGLASTRFFTHYAGFKEISKVSYKEFKVDGKIPFEKVREELATHYVSIERQLNPESKL